MLPKPFELAKRNSRVLNPEKFQEKFMKFLEIWISVFCDETETK